MFLKTAIRPAWNSALYKPTGKSRHEIGLAEVFAMLKSQSFLQFIAALRDLASLNEPPDLRGGLFNRFRNKAQHGQHHPYPIGMRRSGSSFSR